MLSREEFALGFHWVDREALGRKPSTCLFGSVTTTLVVHNVFPSATSRHASNAYGTAWATN